MLTRSRKRVRSTDEALSWGNSPKLHPDHGEIPPGLRQLWVFCPSLTHLKLEWTALIYSWRTELPLHQGKGTKYFVFGATELLQENKKYHTGCSSRVEALSPSATPQHLTKQTFIWLWRPKQPRSGWLLLWAGLALHGVGLSSWGSLGCCCILSNNSYYCSKNYPGTWQVLLQCLTLWPQEAVWISQTDYLLCEKVSPFVWSKLSYH